MRHLNRFNTAPRPTEDSANAKLIAAASDMAEALRDYVDQTTRYINSCGDLPDATKARAALAKAGLHTIPGEESTK